MLIPKSYLTTPKPPAWYYENIHMTQNSEINDDLRGQLFSYSENTRVFDSKKQIEKFLPEWIKNSSDVVVAGGCFASSLLGDTIKDIDIFVLGNSKYPATETITHNNIKSLMIKSFPDVHDKTLDYVRNNDAVVEVWTEKKKKLQFIFTHHISRQDLIKDFDYVHCMTSYQQGKLYITRKIYDAIMDKELIVNNGKNVQEWRRNKFLDRGYKEIVENKEVTLGDILAGALKPSSTNGSKIKTSYVSYEDDDMTWVR